MPREAGNGGWLLRRISILVGLVLVLALAERGGRWACARGLAATRDAEWIWAAEGEPGAVSAAFFAVRDFELVRYPLRARLTCLADEESLLHLNGTLVGARRYREGDRPAAYEVGYMLRKGMNRLVVELRSGAGTGGLLLLLEVEGQPPVRVRSDREWRIVRAYQPHLFEPGSALEEAEEPMSWGAPPVGRWSFTVRAPEQPVFEDLTRGAGAMHAVRALAGEGGSRWIALGPPDWRSPPLGHRVTLDWGRQVAGYLNVVFPRTAAALALVYFGDEPVAPGSRPPDTYLIHATGRRSWADTEPRRFRYVTVVSTSEVSGARVFPVDEGLVEIRPLSGAGRRGVFGLEPLRLRPPVEHEIRGELESVASLSGGQEL